MDQPSQQVLHPATNATSPSPMFPLPVSNATSLMLPPAPVTILPSTDAVNTESTSSPPMKAATSSPHVSPMLQTLAAPVANGQDMLFPIGTTTKTKICTTTKAQAGMNGGRWTEQEHQSFLAGLRLYGREWKKVASKIKTRTSAQIRSHAQKYFAKLARDDEARKQSHLLQSLQQDGAASSAFGYVSDGSSSSATSINITTELAIAETDPTTSPTVVPTQAPMQPASRPAGKRIVLPVTTLSTLAVAPPVAGAKTYKAIRPAIGFVSKKRSRSLTLEAPLSSPSLTVKRPKISGDTQAVSEPERLPSPEELVAKVSPNVRQRLASLIDAEVSALQVLSCIWWLQEQDTAPQKSPLATQCTHMSMGNATRTLAFAPSAQVNLAMPATDSAPSIY